MIKGCESGTIKYRDFLKHKAKYQKIQKIQKIQKK